MTFNFVSRLVLASSLVLAACAGTSGSSGPPEPAAPGQEQVARVYHSRCGACHVRVERGEKTRAQLESALARHRSRVRMSEDDWGKMVDYLAAKDQASRETTRAQ